MRGQKQARETDASLFRIDFAAAVQHVQRMNEFRFDSERSLCRTSVRVAVMRQDHMLDKKAELSIGTELLSNACNHIRAKVRMTEQISRN